MSKKVVCGKDGEVSKLIGVKITLFCELFLRNGYLKIFQQVFRGASRLAQAGLLK